MAEKTCVNCHYFKQHYSLDNESLFRVYCGHCIFTKPKHRRPDSKACDHYTLSAGNTHAFVNKKYLSKKLFEHILNMNLLPEINDDPVFTEALKNRE